MFAVRLRRNFDTRTKEGNNRSPDAAAAKGVGHVGVVNVPVFYVQRRRHIALAAVAPRFIVAAWHHRPASARGVHASWHVSAHVVHVVDRLWWLAVRWKLPTRTGRNMWWSALLWLHWRWRDV